MDKGLFSSATAVAAKFDVTINPPTGGGDSRIFPAAKTVGIAGKDGEPVRLVNHFTALRRFPLNTQDGPYTEIAGPIDIIIIKNPTELSRYLEALGKITAAVPGAPFVPGQQNFGKFATDLYNAIPKNKEVAYTFANLSFPVNPTGRNCMPAELHQGYQALIWDTNFNSPNVIKVAESANFCFYVTQDADPDLLYASQPATGCASTIPADAKPLHNPNVMWFVVAYPRTPRISNNPLIAPLARLSNENDFGSFVAGAQSFNDRLGREVIDKRTVGRWLDAAEAQRRNSRTAIVPRADSPANVAAATVVNALAECKRGGIPAEECF
ncbi:MAG: hypothetical protein HQL41_11830 [Alphaproteobacteria bacterium]|nr:hypothetical protein [Alphaproteobacteria bacterium]